MCELLGMSANVPTDICFSFAGLMQRGGCTGPHKDGFGIVFYEGKGIRGFRDYQPSADSDIARFVRDYPLKSQIVISHIRQANRGGICLENTHPFNRELWGRYWTFAHNGQLKGIKKLALTDMLPVGTTDSEHAFCWMLSQIRQRFPKPPRDNMTLWRFVQGLADQLAELGVFNMLLSDSKDLVAYCGKRLSWITRKAPFGDASLIDDDMQVDFGSETTPNDIVTIIATRPLTDNEQWNIMQRGEMRVFRQGILER
ncbi:class II glutamine amidotransferase [Pelagibaculum spongiae]|uniref:Class II glutamine amidotransferase n=1 Tax=Pelagibaculum spongiae TaxID=2080658 RepID=A0A2V1GSD4_9GAMM|nr:class II glutamine amidotransferase [Pelagibaculum spongiae]PVZ64958.1 class II glutamine amidotransferase [Pelagibaculum spongiae]